MGLFRSAFTKDVSLSAPGWATMLQQPTWSGALMGYNEAAKVSTVYACWRIIAGTLATLHVDAVKTVFDSEANAKEIIAPRPSWLDKPNAEMIWPEWIGQAIISYLADGNLFIDIRQQPSLFVLDPRMVVTGRVKGTYDRANLADNELIYRVGGTTFKRGELIHLRSPITLPGSDRGLSPLECARQEAGIAMAQQRFAATFFANGATVSAVLEMPAGTDEKQARAMKAMWEEDHQGSDKANKTGYLWGDTHYKPMGVTHDQAQFIEQREHSVIDIGTRIFGIPPHRLGVTTRQTSFGSGMEQQNLALVQDALLLPATLLEQGLGEYLLPTDVTLRFLFGRLLRGDAKTRAANHHVAIMDGVICPDEARAEEGLNPIPGGKGKAYMQQQTLVPLGTEPTAATATDSTDSADSGGDFGGNGNGNGDGNGSEGDAAKALRRALTGAHCG